jgi:hypothetical protein
LWSVTRNNHENPQTGNSLFSQIRTRVMIHETTGILPCRGVREGLLHSPSPRNIAFSGGLSGFPRAPYSQESADNAVGVSAPVAMRLPPGHSHKSLWVSPYAFDKACELWQGRCFAPPGPPGNRRRSSAIPPRPSGTVPQGLGIASFFLSQSN